MATYTFAAATLNQFVSWNDPSVWQGHVVPNSPDADVLIPEIIELSNNEPFSYDITIASGSHYEIKSLDITFNNLDIDGTLAVANSFTLDESSNLSLSGSLAVANGFTLNQDSELNIQGSLSVGSLVNAGIDMQGNGEISSPGSISNLTSIVGDGLTLTSDAFQNSGTLVGSSLLTINVTGPAGSFANLSGSTLSGGTYKGDLDLNIGGSIVTDAAAIFADGTIATFDTNTGTYVPLQATLQTIAATGALIVPDGGSYTNDGSLIVHGTIDLTQTFMNTGQTETVAAPGFHVAQGGEIVADSGVVSGPIVNDGVVMVTLGPTFVGPLFGPTSGDLMLQSAITGSGSLVIAAGTTVVEELGFFFETFYPANTLEIGGAASNNVSFTDNSGALVLDQPQSFTGTIIPQFYAGTVAPPSGGDTVVLSGISLSAITGYSYSGDSNSGTLTLQRAGGDLMLDFAGDYVTSSFTLTAGTQQFSTSPPSVLITETSVPCLAAGTRVMTAQGEVRVEDLIVGDTLETVSGETLPIIWIGRRKVSCRQHPCPQSVRPVRVARDAFAPNRPSRPLMLSPDHAVFVSGVLIPVRYLINDITITHAAVDEVTYYHVELPRHHVLLAEGLPVESYLDTGDRRDFGDADGTVRLFPEFTMRLSEPSLVWDGRGFARLVVTGPELDATRLQLERRARLIRRPVRKRA
jgi:hypothetical protein